MDPVVSAGNPHPPDPHHDDLNYDDADDADDADATDADAWDPEPVLDSGFEGVWQQATRPLIDPEVARVMRHGAEHKQPVPPIPAPQPHTQTHPQSQLVRSTVRADGITEHNYFSRQFKCEEVGQYGRLTTRELHRYRSSDKVILPPSALHSFANFSPDNLYVLRITTPSPTPAHRKTLYVTVGDFTAPEGTMYVPAWMLEHLGAHPGQTIRVDAVGVPKVTEARIKMPDGLQEKLGNSQVDLKSVVEFLLRNHLLLFTGKRLSHRMFDMELCFEVVDLKPAPAGNVANADVRLELI